MLDDVLPTQARDEVTALRFTCMHCHSDGRTRRRRGRRTQTKETGGPTDDRRTGAETETQTDRKVDGQTEAQVADHVS